MENTFKSIYESPKAEVLEVDIEKTVLDVSGGGYPNIPVEDL